MVISVEKNYKIHRFIFVILSLYFFIFIPNAGKININSPGTFIVESLGFLMCAAVFFHLKAIKFEFTRMLEIIAFAAANTCLTFSIFGCEIFIRSFTRLGALQTFFYLLFYFCICYIWTAYFL